jgi:fluoride ion exporter CrcB/FEX
MGEMYDPQLLLQTIDTNKSQITFAFTIVLVFQNIWMIDAIRASRRDAVYSIPLFCTYYWFAHDFGGVIRFNDWFHVYDHWYTKGFWFGLFIANLIECIYLGQFIKYGRKELLPNWSPRAFTVLVLVGLLVAEITFEFFKYAFGDPLFQLDGTITQIIYPALGAALIIKRQNTKGQTVLMWLAFTGMTGLYTITTYLWYGEPFRSWQCIVAGTTATIGGIVMVYVVSLPSERLFGSAAHHAKYASK